MPSPPTIVVHASRALPLFVLAAVGFLIGGVSFVWLTQGNLKPAWVYLVAVAVLVGMVAGRRVIYRPVQLVIEPHGIDIISQQTDLLRWNEMVHVSLFTIPPDGAEGLAIFVTAEAARRLPPTRQHHLPQFADVVDGTRYLVLYGRDLEYPLSEVLAELEARRHGQAGPLTKRAAA